MRARTRVTSLTRCLSGHAGKESAQGEEEEGEEAVPSFLFFSFVQNISITPSVFHPPWSRKRCTAAMSNVLK